MSLEAAEVGAAEFGRMVLLLGCSGSVEAGRARELLLIVLLLFGADRLKDAGEA